jgi:hypothetical protein
LLETSSYFWNNILTWWVGERLRCIFLSDSSFRDWFYTATHESQALPGVPYNFTNLIAGTHYCLPGKHANF